LFFGVRGDTRVGFRTAEVWVLQLRKRFASLQAIAATVVLDTLVCFRARERR